MPFIYAIQEKIYADGILPPEGEWKSFSTKFHIVTKDIAETHEDGAWKLESIDGVSMTRWTRFHNEHRQNDTTKVKVGTPLRDVTGELLAIGDYVMVSDSMSASLGLVEVIGFTPKKVRVRSINSWGSGSAKEPSGLVKVDKSRFF